MLSETITNWFIILYGVCAVIFTAYILNTRAKYEDIRKEKGLEKNTMDKVMTVLTAFIVVASLFVAYNTIITIFKIF